VAKDEWFYIHTPATGHGMNMAVFKIPFTLSQHKRFSTYHSSVCSQVTHSCTCKFLVQERSRCVCSSDNHVSNILDMDETDGNEEVCL
jgi:hypothetical protein